MEQQVRYQLMLARIIHEDFYCNRRYENQNSCGILSSRQDHTKGARPRKRGGNAPDGGRARRSVGQHTAEDWRPSFLAPVPVRAAGQQLS